MEKINFENKDSFWKKYYELHTNTPPTKSLESAVNLYTKEKGTALDIGAGNLRDTKFLLQQGFEVTAVDSDTSSLALSKELNHPSLTMIQERIGSVDLPENNFDLVNAQNILFHLSPERLQKVMDQVRNSIKQQGIFCGNFLGEHDSWNIEGSKMSFVDKMEIEELLKGFEIKIFEEQERDSASASTLIDGTNKLKHWHILRVVAVKE